MAVFKHQWRSLGRNGGISPSKPCYNPLNLSEGVVLVKMITREAAGCDAVESRTVPRGTHQLVRKCGCNTPISTLLRSNLSDIKATRKVQATGQFIMDHPCRPISSPSLLEVYLRSDGNYSDFPPARVRESTPDQFSPPPHTREPPTRELPLAPLSSTHEAFRTPSPLVKSGSAAITNAVFSKSAP